jgi:ABC-type transport system involved in cytochrome bd biosynthesis fused ATPase/permease subunit
LLDEPDANLDLCGVRCVVQVVRELAGNRMVALAAHTSEVMDAADVWISLGSGPER